MPVGLVFQLDYFRTSEVFSRGCCFARGLFQEACFKRLWNIKVTHCRSGKTHCHPEHSPVDLDALSATLYGYPSVPTFSWLFRHWWVCVQIWPCSLTLLVPKSLILILGSVSFWGQSHPSRRWKVPNRGFPLSLLVLHFNIIFTGFGHKNTSLRGFGCFPGGQWQVAGI